MSFASVDKYSGKVKFLSGVYGYTDGKYVVVLPDFMPSDGIVFSAPALIINKGLTYQNQFSYTSNIIDEFVTTVNINSVTSTFVQIGNSKTTKIGLGGNLDTLPYPIAAGTTNFFVHIDAFTLTSDAPTTPNVPTTINVKPIENHDCAVQLSVDGGAYGPIVPQDTNIVLAGNVNIKAKITSFTSDVFVSSLIILSK